MALTSSITTKITANQTNVIDLGAGVFPLNLSVKTSMADGTGSGQSDLLFSDQRTLSASATEDLDLAGSLTDAFGSTLTFVKIKAIVITAAAGNTNNVTVSPDATNGFTGPFNAVADLISIPPGGSFVVTAPASGWTVTASTGDLLTLANSGAGTSVTYDIVLIGTSA